MKDALARADERSHRYHKNMCKAIEYLYEDDWHIIEIGATL